MGRGGGAGGLSRWFTICWALCALSPYLVWVHPQEIPETCIYLGGDSSRHNERVRKGGREGAQFHRSPSQWLWRAQWAHQGAGNRGIHPPTPISPWWRVPPGAQSGLWPAWSTVRQRHKESVRKYENCLRWMTSRVGGVDREPMKSVTHSQIGEIKIWVGYVLKRQRVQRQIWKQKLQNSAIDVKITRNEQSSKVLLHWPEGLGTTKKAFIFLKNK